MISNNNTANGEYRIGLKTFFDLSPTKVRENQLNAEKTRKWDKPNKIAIAEISRKINEFETQNNGNYAFLTKIKWVLHSQCE